MLAGLHHITAIAGDPQKNVEFYTQVLGLRLVKRTVNFDDPGSYHFYFGDHEGAPGIRVRNRARVHQVLVVEELVALGSHVRPVEAEHPAELRRVVDLEELEGRAPSLDERALEIDAARVVQTFEDLL